MGARLPDLRAIAASRPISASVFGFAPVRALWHQGAVVGKKGCGVAPPHPAFRGAAAPHPHEWVSARR